MSTPQLWAYCIYQKRFRFEGKQILFFTGGLRQTAIQNNWGIAPRIRDMHLFTLCLFTLATGVTSLNLCQRLRYRVWGLNMLNAWGIVCNIVNGIITKVYINTDKNIQEYNVRYHQVCLTLIVGLVSVLWI